MTGGPLKTLSRAFEVIDALKYDKQMGVTEIANRLDMAPSTASDYLRSLEGADYAISHNGKYALSTKFLETGGILKYKMRIFQSSRPELANLADATGELTTLCIEENGMAVQLHIAEGENAHHFGVYPGIRFPMHSQASGKVILASYEREEFDQFVDTYGLEERTENTITDRFELIEELERIHEQGYATDYDEEVQGLGLVSAPIRIEEESEVLGSISVVTPTHKLRRPDFERKLIDEVLETANLVAMNFRYGTRQR